MSEFTNHMIIERKRVQATGSCQVKFVNYKDKKRRLPRKRLKLYRKYNFNYKLFKIGLWLPQCFNNDLYHRMDILRGKFDKNNDNGK